MENLAKATPIIAIAALVCGLVGLIFGIVAFQKSSEMDAVTEIKDANATISESVAGLQTEMDGISKKYVTLTQLKEFANSTQDGFNQITDTISKTRTDVRANTIKVAELDTKIQSGGVVRKSAPSSSTPSASADSPTATSSGPAGGVEYTIQSGDTLGKVAANFGVSLDMLLSANPGVQPRYLKVGQIIVIPE
ncbi:MAG: LysM domain-containing protein [Opitutales bacterium]|jgi:LysM repeat protein|nr:LysM domain-containing protein [Opitutales bacterium]